MNFSNTFLVVALCVSLALSQVYAAESLKVISVSDTSSVDSPEYSLCKRIPFQVTDRNIGLYLKHSAKIEKNAWLNLEHYPCKRGIALLSHGRTLQLKLNLSGAGVLFDNGSEETYLYCDARCMKKSRLPLVR